MNNQRKEELLKLFSVSLALVACSALVYMIRTPSITGMAILPDNSVSSISIVILLILAGIAVVLGAIVAIHKIKQELDQHKEQLEKKTPLAKNVDIALATYVAKAKEKGFSDTQIAERLKDMNWDSKDIKKIL
ncbi:MAG TPA: hypothetical protein VKE88_01790 [Candidatus Nanoarchaeia archaeon]|nr:hypothetical protein [Candidatus Nanoarchaeia archaeon]